MSIFTMIVSKVPIAEAENIAAHDFIEGIGDFGV
jgi:hypothetical protein